MSKVTKDVFIVASKRTPFGSFGGSFKTWSPVQLGVEAAKGAIAQLPSADIIDNVYFGNVAQSTTDTCYLARHVALKAGVPMDKPALTVNRLCTSGFQTIINAAQDIMLGEAEVVLTGGAESMSMAPYQVHGIRWGSPLGVNPPMVDSLWECLQDKHAGCPMAITAENLAEKYGITKEEADEFALRSQQLYGKALEAGIFKDEIAPITVKDRKKGEVTLDYDEGARPKTTAENLAKLKPLFKKGGTVSAGNASGISDGAGAVVVASGEAVQKHGLKPLARVVSYGVVGVEPEIMGIGPVPSIKEALRRADLTLDDIDLFEINEAFASQVLSCQKALDYDLMPKLNLHGGAIALGHPTGASGSRIMGKLAYDLQRTGSKYALGTACAGGGQGVAVILERA